MIINSCILENLMLAQLVAQLPAVLIDASKFRKRNLSRLDGESQV